MKNIKLTQKGKRFFTGLVMVGFVGVVGLSNLNNNNSDEVVYIDEYQTVYASDVEQGADGSKNSDEGVTQLENNTMKNITSDYKITHVYEDGCLDVIEPIDGEYKFYCEADFN